MAPRSISRMSSASPKSRWSLISPSNEGISPTSVSVTKFSSPPEGTPSSTILGKAPKISLASRSASSTAELASLTRAESSLTWARSSCLRSPDAPATSLPKAFCSARNASYAEMASRRAVSAAIALSTCASSPPRARSEARICSGSSRSIWGSITPVFSHAPSGEPARKCSSHVLASTKASSL